MRVFDEGTLMSHATRWKATRNRLAIVEAERGDKKPRKYGIKRNLQWRWVRQPDGSLTKTNRSRDKDMRDGLTQET